MNAVKMFTIWMFCLATLLGYELLFNVPRDMRGISPVAHDEDPRVASPADTQPEQPAEEPLIVLVAKGAGKEFDGRHTLNRPLTEFEKSIAREAVDIAKAHDVEFFPASLEVPPDVLERAVVVITVRGVDEEFDGTYLRDRGLERWEVFIGRSLMKLAKRGGGEHQPEPKADEKK